VDLAGFNPVDKRKFSSGHWLININVVRYLESLTTLYSSNQFHISLEPIFALELPSLLLPARRSLVKHLELLLLHTSFGKRDIYWRTGTPIFGEAVACIIETFPNLQTLSLCALTKDFDFEDYQRSYADPQVAMLETVLGPLDGLAKYYGFGKGKKEFMFTVEAGHYQEIKKAVGVEEDDVECVETWNGREKFWKEARVVEMDEEVEVGIDGKLDLERRVSEASGIGYTICSRSLSAQVPKPLVEFT
jgi:hypothetical protein